MDTDLDRFCDVRPLTRDSRPGPGASLLRRTGKEGGVGGRPRDGGGPPPPPPPVDEPELRRRGSWLGSGVVVAVSLGLMAYGVAGKGVGVRLRGEAEEEEAGPDGCCGAGEGILLPAAEAAGVGMRERRLGWPLILL